MFIKSMIVSRGGNKKIKAKFNSRITVLYGLNGCGKTTILNSIHDEIMGQKLDDGVELVEVEWGYQFVWGQCKVRMLPQWNMSQLTESIGEYRWREINQVSQNPNQPNILLIDHLELCMHLDWQRRALPLLESSLLNTQIIVTTHSPVVLRPYHDDQCYEMK